MIVPVTNVTGNDETVSDYKLYEYKGSDDSNKVCFFIRITRLVTKCLCPNSPYFFQPLVSFTSYSISITLLCLPPLLHLNICFTFPSKRVASSSIRCMIRFLLSLIFYSYMVVLINEAIFYNTPLKTDTGLQFKEKVTFIPRYL